MWTPTSPSQGRARWLIGTAILALVAGLIIGWWGRAQQERRADVAERQATTAVRSLEAQCLAGIQSACDQLRTLAFAPDPDDPESQEDEVQEPEVQEPELQDDEQQDPELQDPERPDGETQEAENQEAERQDAEVQDGDNDDPETQDDEIQDPEIDDPEPNDPDPDDPDPNSALQFAVADNCNPPAGEYVSDVGLSVQRGGGTVTYVLTCTSSPLPTIGPPQPEPQPQP